MLKSEHSFTNSQDCKYDLEKQISFRFYALSPVTRQLTVISLLFQKAEKLDYKFLSCIYLHYLVVKLFLKQKLPFI